MENTKYNITSEDIEYFKQVDEAVKRGFLVNGTRLTDLYNRVFNANIRPTNCMSCLRGRYKALKPVFDNLAEKIKAEEVETPTEEIIAPTSKKVVKRRSKNAE